MDDNKKYCQKCDKMMDVKQFYKKANGEYMNLCKQCLTMHIDNFKPETFLWILKEMDYPYIEEEWNKTRDKAFAANPNLKGISVLGKYLSKMKINQFRNLRWADSEEIAQKRMAHKAQLAIERQEYEDSIKKQFEDGEITEAQYKTLISTQTQHDEYIPPAMIETNNPFQEDKFLREEDLDLGIELTDEEKKELALKWGRSYKESEWIALEEDYNRMCESFDIQDADTINTLKLICKTNLQANQALDSRDIEGFQKLSKVLEGLRKSAKFTAAQNKEDKEEFVDCVGNLVAYCEKNGGAIPRYSLDYDVDIIDKVIKDLKNYTKTLIYEDKSLSRQIEEYLRKKAIIEQQKADQSLADKTTDGVVMIEDDDYKDYFNSIKEQQELDKDMLYGDYDNDEESDE